VHRDDLGQPLEDGAEALGERLALVGDDAAAADIFEARPALLDDAVARDAEARVDAEDADRAVQLKTAVV
jgi:hypothetical protein